MFAMTGILNVPIISSKRYKIQITGSRYSLVSISSVSDANPQPLMSSQGTATSTHAD